MELSDWLIDIAGGAANKKRGQPIDFEAENITAFEFRDNQIKRVKTHDLVQEAHTIWANTQSFCGGWDPVTLF